MTSWKRLLKTTHMDSNIQLAKSLYPFTEREKIEFLRWMSEGLKEEMALHKSGLEPHLLSDMLAALPPHAMSKAKLASEEPLVEVKLRMNELMRSARDGDNALTLDQVIMILERKAPEEWSKRNFIELRQTDPQLPIEEKRRLESLFGLPETIFIEGEVIKEKDA